MERLEEELKLEEVELRLEEGEEELENGTKEKSVKGEREWLSGCDERIMRQIRPVSSYVPTQHSTELQSVNCLSGANILHAANLVGGHGAASMPEREDRKER